MMSAAKRVQVVQAVVIDGSRSHSIGMLCATLIVGPVLVGCASGVTYGDVPVLGDIVCDARVARLAGRESLDQRTYPVSGTLLLLVWSNEDGGFHVHEFAENPPSYIGPRVPVSTVADVEWIESIVAGGSDSGGSLSGNMREWYENRDVIRWYWRIRSWR